jgi:hypothetical protein
MKLTDADVKKLRELAEHGRTPGELAEFFGISRRHAARLASGESRPELSLTKPEDGTGPVTRSLEDFLGSLAALDPEQQIHAATARQLARAIDAAARIDSAAALAALPRLALQLAESVALLSPRAHDLEAQVRRMLAPIRKEYR